jgi:glycolate oxidase
VELTSRAGPAGNGERTAVPARERAALIQTLREIVGPPHVLVEPEDVIVYEQDGSILQAVPEIVVLPGSAEEVQAVVRTARAAGVSVVPRGAGTGLAGGAVAADGGVVVALTRLNRLREVDLRSRTAVVEPGVVNLEVTKEITPQGYFYAPDPSSQAACSVGGNLANNSGGPHTLAYGVTTNHAMGV